MNLVTPKARAKHEPFVQQTGLSLELDQLLLLWQTIFTFFINQATLIRDPIVLGLPL